MSTRLAPARDRGAVPNPDDHSFECPRCRSAVTDRFYGPCPKCRIELRSSMGHEARQMVREGFEPAMHVTPNAVAMKE
jgi:hypothetical protein